MVVELLNIDFPVDLILGSMFNGDWEISSIVKQSKFRNWNSSAVNCTSSWFLRNWLSNGLIEWHSLSTVSITFLKDSSSTSSDWNLLFVNGFDSCNAQHFFLHVLSWEISESWVLSSGEIGVVIRFPCVGSCLWETFFQVVFDQKLRCGTDSADTVWWLHVCHDD